MTTIKNIPAAAAYVLGAIACVLGLSVVGGWALGISVLLRVAPQWPAMALYSAIALALSGAVLWAPALLGGLQVRRMRLACASILITYSALALLETLLDFDLGIEPHALHRALNHNFKWPGRMAPSTAFCFILLGAAFLLLNYQERYRLDFAIRALAISVALLAAISLFGYLGSVEFLYSWGGITTMAAHTAFGLVLVGLGVWFTSYAQSAREDVAVARIMRMATALLVTLGIVTGLTSFALAQRQTELSAAN
ncbi:MAG TPA: hypothetical protein VLC91_04845, partial [Spongiibacteraceae bacterium]|nr:hypothetical protein [Spongiibacteraceae bacterium]